MSLKIGDVVTKANCDTIILTTIVAVEGDVVLGCRHFNGRRYWDNQSYWRLATEEDISIENGELR